MPKSGARLSHPREKYPRRYQTFRALIYSIHIKNPPPCSNPPPPFTDRGYRFPSVIPKKKKIDLWIISRFSSTPSFEPTQSRTFPTEGNFCIHSPRVEGQEVRREEEEEEGGVDRESASNEIDFPLIRLARVHTRDWAPWGGSQWWIKKKKKKVSQPASSSTPNQRPNRVRPVSPSAYWREIKWTSCFLDFLPRHGSPRRVSILVTWFFSPCDCFNTWLVNPFPPPSPLFLPFFSSSILFFISSEEGRENFRFDACVEFSRCNFFVRVNFYLEFHISVDICFLPIEL